MDDNFMSICFDHALDRMEVVLHSILKRDDLEVCEVTTQKSEKSLEYRSVIFDILATDRNGNQYDVEIQKSDSGASFRRARHYSSAREYFSKVRQCHELFVQKNHALLKSMETEQAV